MQEAKNPYGEGNSSEKILEALLKFEKEGKLDINSPYNIMNGLSRSVLMIEDDVTVKEYETINPSTRVQLVFQGEKILFSSPELNLKHKQILLNTH